MFNTAMITGTAKEVGSIKRRKTAPVAGLENLPDQLLAAVAEYLVIPSRALLAVALTAPSSSHKWSSENVDARHLSSATNVLLMSSDSVNMQWERVDFGHIEESLAEKLTDNDLGAVLACIKISECDIKRLGLGCIEITGRGLETLRHFTSLEQLDLIHAKISSDVLLPILGSIVGDDGSALKHIAIRRVMMVEGCGVEEINGVYTKAGRYDGVAKYTKSAHYNGKDEEFTLFRCVLTDRTRRWYFSIVPYNSQPGTTKDIDFYAAVPYGDLPPKENWMCIPNSGGRNPPPTVGMCKPPEWQELLNRFYNRNVIQNPSCFRCNGYLASGVIQRNDFSTCHECLNMFCMSQTSPSCREHVLPCIQCDKQHCKGCIRRCDSCEGCSKCVTGAMEPCEACGEAICDGCKETCSSCSTKVCSGDQCSSMCSMCNECSGCVTLDHECNDCQQTLCQECIITCACCDWTGCGTCRKFRVCQSGACDTSYCNLCTNHDRDRVDTFLNCTECDYCFCSACLPSECAKLDTICPKCCQVIWQIVRPDYARICFDQS